MTYTREQILAMEPGRELDKIVSEHVTKYQSLTTHLNADGTFGYLPNYSTDIAAAWDLLKEINEKGLVWRIEGARVSVFDPYVGSPADDGSLVHYEIIGSGIADTICKAALLAVLDL
ncbi:BC1872 family protein [Paenibacillus sp. IITD108]|uniref:BC1872 family protein n=1 Tax=Paenibacillus sp. IITD108 TaxID=3116649 RepID=UPI002F410BA2